MNTIVSERKRIGITQKDLSKRIGVSIPTVSRWERGEVMPDGSSLVAMSKLFGCSSDYLLGLTDERYMIPARR